MNSRSFRVLWLLLPLAAAVWFLWPHHQRPSAHPSAPMALAKPVAATPAKPAVVKSAAPAPVISSGSAASTQKTNKFAFRLTNTTKSLRELSHDARAILLENALIDTTGKLDLAIPPKLKSTGDPGAYIVQANGNIDDRFRAMLAADGAQVVSYIPNNAYLVQASAGVAAAISGSGLAAAVLPYEPYYKASSGLLTLLQNQQPLPPGQILNLGVYASAGPQVESQLAALNVSIVAQDQSPFGPIYRVQLPYGADWTALAQMPAIKNLELAYRRKPANDLSRVSMGISADTVTNANYLNLYGSNVVVEVNDSGIDSTHPDFTMGGSAAGGVGSGTGTRIFGDSPGSLTDTNGHGTFVAGIIAGNGAASSTLWTNLPSGSATNADFRGKAPLATLYSVAGLGGFGPGVNYGSFDWVDGYDPTFGAFVGMTAPDISDMSDYYFQTVPALTNALISNNSWTYGGDNEYDLAAASYDAAVRDALPMVTGSQPVLFVFAAGDDGYGNNDGNGADADSIESPATAKNVLTVGSLEEFRNITNAVTDEDGNSNDVYWQAWTDTGNQVAWYSSRGNVGIGVEGDFGRFKPDVVAPGSFIVSTRSSQWNQIAYFDITNSSTAVYQDVLVYTNSVFSKSVVVPANTVGVTIQVYGDFLSPVPFPNTPIYVEQDYPPDPFNYPQDIAFTETNLVTIPPDAGGDIPSLQSVLGKSFWFSVGDGTNIPAYCDVAVTVTTTNDYMDPPNHIFEVLSNNLDRPLGPYYRYETGTSMSAAAVSGMLALIQDFFTNTLQMMPSPALLKAMVINGAQSQGSYQLAVTNAPNDQGWGLAYLPTSLPSGLTNMLSNPTNTPMFFQDQSPTNALATGDSQTFKVKVAPGAEGLPMRFTLVWTDPPGDPAAAIKLVNNLDIIVTNLDSTNVVVYYGNNFSTAGNPSYSFAAATNEPPNLDVVNNVRNIYLSPPLSTNYTVTVFGRSVNVNAVTSQTNSVVQDFALVMSAGDGSVSNGINVVASPVVTNPTGDQDVTFVSTTNNTPLLNQIAGENSPLLGTNTVAVGTNSPLATNGLVTIGMTNQWHFYVVTNALGFTNAAFITFFPEELAVSRMGTLANSAADAVRPEGDVDLYVATDPLTGAGGSLTNLDPTVISNCVNGVGNYRVSAGPGGTEFVAFSNAQPNQVYYIGVKSEDHLGTEYGFLPVFSQYPFSTLNPDGSESVNGLTLPQTIPVGSPTHPSVTLVFALAIYPMTVDQVIVTNTIWHQNFGNLYGQLGHADIFDMLNNHDGFGDTVGSAPLIYYDDANNPISTPIGPVFVPTPLPSDGPGNLVSYQGQEAIGPWILAEADNVPVQNGSMVGYGLRIYPHTPAQKGLDVYIAGGGEYSGYIDVPAGVTNMTLNVTNETLPTTLPPLQVYLKFGSVPSPLPIPTVYDESCVVSNGTAPNVGGSISVTPSSIPPINPGRYYYEIYNPSVNPATNVFIIATFGFAAVHGGATFTSGTVPTALPDDAVMTNAIVITNTDNIYSAAVGVVVDHPRVSDLTLTLLSPAGQRYVLFENRGGNNATNLGHLNIITNFFGSVSAGNGTGSTNVIGPVPTQGTLVVNYDMYSIPDNMEVYYDGAQIFSSGPVANTGQFVIPYGPGTGTNLTIVMDMGGDDTASLWTYTPAVVEENYTYLTFTDDTNYAQVPIKFAIPPFDLTDLGTNYTLTSFEGPTNNIDYLAPTNINDLLGGWNLYTNIPGVGTNIISLTNNEVSIVTDPTNAYDGSNFLALANGTITRIIPTIPTREYTVSFSYRGPGIAGWWRGEGNATDSSTPETNGNNGLLIGQFTFPAGVVGQAFGMENQGLLYEFAGTNNYVQVPQSSSLDVGTGSGMTVEGWINPTNLQAQEPLVEWLSRMPTNPVVTNIVILAGPFLNRGTDHYYYMLGQTNWTVSEQWATNMGGHLVTINDANEQNWVYDTFANYDGTNRDLWIGLNDAAGPTNLVWSSGQTSSYANWLTGQPTNCNGAEFYTAMLGATNTEPGQRRLEQNDGETCADTNRNAYGIVELDVIPTNGVQFWISVTNSPATANSILSSNGCLYANLIDTTNGYHEIWSAPGLVQSNIYQHVALTYDTNSGVATLYYEGTNVCATNLGVFTPKTTGDVLLGKDMSLLTNNFFSGAMDEMSVYSRCLSDAEIAAIYRLSVPPTNGYPTNLTGGLVGKFDPNYNPAESLAEAVVTLGSRTNLILGDNTNWQRVSYSFIADTNSTLFQFMGTEPGMLLDDFTVGETALGNLYYQPEQPLDTLVGESAAGVWTLEIQDNRANDTNAPAQLVSWQLNFVLQTNTPVPVTLSPETPAGNTVPPGQIAYFYVPIPPWAGYATNILVSSTSPVSLLFNPTNPPTGTGPGDITLLANATSSGVNTLVIPTGYLQTNTPPLTTNSYYLGVKNNGTVPAQFVVRVDFDITTLTNGMPVAGLLDTNQDVRYFAFDVTNSNPQEATFQLLKLSGNADLVVSYGAPLPSTTNLAYGSFNVSNADESIYVQTNSSPVPLATNRWYLGVLRNQAGPITYNVLAKELDYGQTNVIVLTNNVPFNFTAGPGAALTNFFRFTVTNAAPQVYFKLYNLTGNGDLTVQSNALPLAPPFYQSSQQPGLAPEYVYLRTNNVLTNLNADWYLGVPNNEITNIHYSIVAVNDSLLITNNPGAFPGAVGAATYTQGGRGSTNIYHVINLNDGGPGSLRYGLNAFTNNVTIVFDVSGNIALQSPLVITNSFMTIAGQTAPGDGVTLQNYPTLLAGAHDIIMRYLRFRLGDQGVNYSAAYATNYPTGDSLAFVDASNVIVDHVSASWSTNALVDVQNSTNITVQWSVIADSLYSTNTNSCLPGQGSILRYGGGSLSFNHNLYADNYVSSPKLGDNLTVDFVNNVVYNWGLLPGWSITNDIVADPNGFTNQLNYVCNYIIATTNSLTNYLAFWGGITNTWVFQTNNFIDSATNFATVVDGVTNHTLNGADTGWGMFTNYYTRFGEPFLLPYPAVTNGTIPSATAEEAYMAYEHVLAFAGDQLSRDRVDLNLIRNVRQQTNVQFIASQTQVGGWPVLSSQAPPLDTDQDGLPDYWEITFGLNPTNAADGANLVTNTGYTELETYLNWLAGPHALTVTTNPVSVDLYHLAGDTGRLTFFVTNALNGSVLLTNEVETNWFYTTNDVYTNDVVTYTNTMAIFTPSNNYTSSFTNPASFDFYVTNNDTVAWFGPVTVSVVVSPTNILTSPTIIQLTNGVPFTGTNDPLFQFTITDSPGAVIFELYNLSNNAAMFVQTNGAPVAPYYLASSGPGTNSQLILVQTNFALTNIGSVNLSRLNEQWNIEVTNAGGYTIVAQEIPVSPTIIDLTNNVPFTYTAGPGPDLTNFFRYTVTNAADAVQFSLSGQSGNCDLTAQTNALPFAPVYYAISQQPGNNSELIQAPAGTGSLWYLGVPNNDPAQNTYTIMAQEGASLATPIPTNSPQTNVLDSGGTTYYLVDVPPNADLATNALISATGPVDLWYSTNTPPTTGSPDDALLLQNSTGGTNVFGTSVTSQIIGSTELVPGGFYYLAVYNPTASSVTYAIDVNFHLVPLPVTAPAVTTLPAANVTAFAATLRASVVPEGATTTVYFAYGPTTNYGNFSTSVVLTNSLYSTFPVAIGVTNLLPGNIWHYQAIGTNSVGTNYGLDLTFTNPAAAPTVTTLAATGVSSTGATLNALVNPNGAAATVWFAYGTNTSYGHLTGTVQLTGSLNTAQPVALSVSGLLPGVIYHYQAVGTNSGGTNYGLDLTFTTLAAAPTVTTLAATNITSTSATLRALVDPNGAPATVWFAYGTNTSYGGVSSNTLLSGNLTTAQTVGLSVSNLLPGVVYHFQAIGTNIVGANNGVDLTFTTPPIAPTVVTLAVTNNTATNTILPALVTPNGAAATVYFAYGTTTNYSNATATTGLSGNLNSAQPVAIAVSNLLAGVLYHYQAIAYNSVGTNYGLDLTFVAGTQPVSFSSIIATNAGYLLSWYAPTNYQFKVQWAGSLITTNWFTFTNIVVYAGPLTATNGLFTYFDNGSQSGGFGSMRFYQLILVPAANSVLPVLPPPINGSVYYLNPLTTLVVTNTATDVNPNAVLTYTVSGTLAGTNLPVVGTNNGIVTWTPSIAQAGLTNVITTMVTDNGAIPLGATNSFVVIVNPLPAFSDIAITPDGVLLDWTGVSSNQYQIGWTTNLLTPWTYVPTNAPYLNSPTKDFFYLDTNSQSQMKFYQLRLAP